LLGVVGSWMAGLGLGRLEGLGVAPQQPRRRVGAVVAGGDVQGAGSGAGGQFGVQVAGGVVM
jgi:hypothetical protein